MAGKGGPWWGLTLSLSQGSLLKVVLEDYLRLKKLFAQRMVQKASSCHSSISEVAGRARSCVLCPSTGDAHSFPASLPPCLPPTLPLSPQPPFSFSESLEISSQGQRQQ